MGQTLMIMKTEMLESVYFVGMRALGIVSYERARRVICSSYSSDMLYAGGQYSRLQTFMYYLLLMWGCVEAGGDLTDDLILRRHHLVMKLPEWLLRYYQAHSANNKYISRNLFSTLLSISSDTRLLTHTLAHTHTQHSLSHTYNTLTTLCHNLSHPQVSSLPSTPHPFPFPRV